MFTLIWKSVTFIVFNFLFQLNSEKSVKTCSCDSQKSRQEFLFYVSDLVYFYTAYVRKKERKKDVSSWAGKYKFNCRP